MDRLRVRTGGESWADSGVRVDMSPWISDLYLSSQSDARLLSLTRDGHARAFTILVERYRSELLAHARRVAANGNAEDIVQQTFLNAYSAVTRGVEVGHLRGWLYAILRNAATRAHAPAEAGLEEFDACGEPLEVTIEHRDSARSVISALEELPSRQRQALLGSSWQGLSRAELAASLGISEGAVRQLVHRGRMAIRSAITALTPYPLARWLAGSGPATGPGPELALTAGAASAGGVLAKVGLFAAVGAIATGITAVETHHGAHPVRARHARITPRTVLAPGLAAPVVSAATTAPAGAVGEYVSGRATGSRAAAVSGRHMRRSGSGAAPTISGGALNGGPRFTLPSGSLGHTGSGSGRDSGSPGASGSGSGRASAPGSGDHSGSGSGHSGLPGSGGSDSGGSTSTTPTSGSNGGSGNSTDGGGGGGSPSGSAHPVDTGHTGVSTTSGQSTRDLWPPTGSSPIQDH